jgi:sugar/nucleoside kinase (ribokinase family)
MAEKGIVGFGASNADLKYEVEEIILDGETYIKSFTRASGGSARNTIYAAAMLGLRTGYIGAVGNDENGKFILEELESAGIDIRGIKIFDEIGRAHV